MTTLTSHTRRVALVLALLSAVCSARVGAGDMAIRAAGEHISVHAAAGDERDYSRLAAVMDSAYVRIRDRLRPGFDGPVDVFVYPTQPDLWQAALGTRQPSHPIRGFCDVDRGRILLTSLYEDCYPPEHRYRVPVHELTHIIYSHGFIWIREGIAHYESGMLGPFDAGDLPTCEADLVFYRDVDQTRRSYNFSAWIVKYIVEELGRGEYDVFLDFAARDGDYRALGHESESAFFDAWNEYMEKMAREGRSDSGESAQG